MGSQWLCVLALASLTLAGGVLADVYGKSRWDWEGRVIGDHPRGDRQGGHGGDDTGPRRGEANFLRGRLSPAMRSSNAGKLGSQSDQHRSLTTASRPTIAIRVAWAWAFCLPLLDVAYSRHDVDRPSLFQRRAIPSTEVCRRHVSALQEVHERAPGLRRSSHRLIR
jgi:hypothetical protein